MLHPQESAGNGIGKAVRDLGSTTCELRMDESSTSQYAQL